MSENTVPTPLINLTRKRGDIIDRVIHWALTAGRAVIIGTEVIALSAFLMRFGLDRQIIDLNGEIRQKRAILVAENQNENTYRALQNRLQTINVLNNTATKQVLVYTDMQALVPSDTSIDLFSYTPALIRLEVTTPSVDSLNKYVNTLKAYSGVIGVSLDRVENKVSRSTITANIAITFSQPKEVIHANDTK